jgi:hypothetical protein
MKQETTEMIEEDASPTNLGKLERREKAAAS